MTDNNNSDKNIGNNDSNDNKRRRRVTKPIHGAIHDVHQKVRTAKKRSVQSARWLERQLNDPYVKLARAEGWRSRAAFKIREIDDAFGIFSKDAKILDLGAAPGGWSQVAMKRGAKNIVAIDLLHVEPIDGVTIFQGDFCDDNMQKEIIDALGGYPDVIMSDMAANTVGHKQTDHLRTVALAELAADFAIEFLKPGGHFVTKVFQGGSQIDMLTRLKQNFKQVKHFKPDSSRKESVELFLVALNRKDKA